MSEEQSHRRNRLLPAAIKLFIIVVVLWFIRRTIVDACDELGTHSFHLDFLWLAAGGGLYLLGTFFFALFWYCTLRSLGQRVGFGKAARAYYIGHLGKYVPGKAMVVILRAGLVRGEGIDASLAVASVFYETLTMMSTGALLGAAIVAFCFHGQTILLWAAVAIMVAAGLPTLPPVFRRLVRLFGVGRLSLATTEKLDRLGYGAVMLGWMLNALGWAILGMSYWAVLRAMGGAENNPFLQLHLHTAAVALATVAGFVSMAPGGAVVREAVLTELTVPYLGGATALLGAVVLRLVWLVSEAGISAILYLTTRRRGRRKIDSPKK